MILELPKKNIEFGNMGYIKNGILYVLRINSFFDLMYEITYCIYGAERCWYCGQSCKRGKGEKEDMRPRITLDHMIPTIIGGPTIVNNLRPCCPKCNSKNKGDYTAEQFLELTKMENEKKKNETRIYKINAVNNAIEARKREMRKENEDKKRGKIPYLPKEYTEAKVNGQLNCLIHVDTKLGKQFERQKKFYKEYDRIKQPVIVSSNNYVLAGMNSIFIAKIYGVPEKLQMILLENVILVERGRS